MIDKALYSSNSDEWYTPTNLFKKLNEEFDFNLDPCADKDNHNGLLFNFTKENNGLDADWGGYRAFVNPPYSDIYNWVSKCYYESLKPGTLVVLLVHARMDTRWFHDFCYNRAEIRFIRGRLKYEQKNMPANKAPFPTMIVIFRSAKLKE